MPEKVVLWSQSNEKVGTNSLTEIGQESSQPLVGQWDGGDVSKVLSLSLFTLEI